MLGFRVIYFNMNRFLETLAQVRLEGSYLKWLKQLNRYNLLIFDDFGLKPLSHDARLTLLDILEDRYEGAATIFTSQLPLDKWYDYINEPSLADYHNFFIMRSNISLPSVRQVFIFRFTEDYFA
jgi:DNA replication protein DnaC